MQKRGELQKGFLVVALVLLAMAYFASSLNSGSGFVIRSNRANLQDTSVKTTTNSLSTPDDLLFVEESRTPNQPKFDWNNPSSYTNDWAIPLLQTKIQSPITFSIMQQPSFNLLLSQEKKQFYIKEIREKFHPQVEELQSSLFPPLNQFEQLTKFYQSYQSEPTTVDILVWFKNTPTLSSIGNDLNGEKNFIRNLQDQFLSQIPQVVRVKYRYNHLNGLALTIPNESTLDTILLNPQVDYVTLDKIVEPHLVQSRPLIRANLVENQLGLNGSGSTICVLDTGIDYTHANLGACTTTQFLAGQCNKVVAGYDFVNMDPDPMDDHGHGTHVAGIIASDHNLYRGVAPQTQLAAIKVLSSFGFGSYSAIAAGIDWCVQNAAQYNIKVITMSLGEMFGFFNRFNCPNYIDLAIQRALQANIFLDAGSGNYASLSGITYPACAPGVVSVGAVYDANVGSQSFSNCYDSTTAQDQITCFTQRNSELDILAPGSVITSTTSYFGGSCGAPLSSGFGICSGTSMSAPHIAGVASLIYQLNPNLTSAQIENSIETFATSVLDPKTSIEFPRVDAFNSVQSTNQPYISVESKPRIGETLTVSISDALHQNKLYYLLFSTSTSPGITLPDNRVIPLTPNDIFFLSLNPQSFNFQNAQGVLDNSGYATATWNIPAFIPVGLTIYFSFLTVDQNLSFPQNIISISPPKSITFDSSNQLILKNSRLPYLALVSSCATHSNSNNLYCFGIRTIPGLSNQILEYNPTSDTLTIKNAVLPTARGSLSCTDSSLTNNIYCFGGQENSGLSNQILEYNPTSDTLTIKNAVLPTARYYLSCTDSSLTNNIYCFGGFDNNFRNQIFEYNPISDTIITKSAILPSPMASSCTDSSLTNNIYCFGGRENSGWSNRILEYNPTSDTLTIKNAVLPTARIYDLSACLGISSGKIYCLGAQADTFILTSQILEYNPSIDLLTIKRDTLRTPRVGIGCSQTSSNKIYCLGGYEGIMPFSFTYLDEILEYTPP